MQRLPQAAIPHPSTPAMPTLPQPCSASPPTIQHPLGHAAHPHVHTVLLGSSLQERFNNSVSSSRTEPLEAPHPKAIIWFSLPR